MVQRRRAASALALALGLAWLACCRAAGRALQEPASQAVALGPCTPTQVHIALTGNPTEMRVMWKTQGGSCPTLVTSGPAAALAQNPPDAGLLHKHSGRQRSYSTADMCAAPAADGRWGTSFHHSAVLTGLQPGERYFYQIEGGAPIEFRAAVPTGPTHRFRFLVFGDMGESEHREAKSPGASRTVELLHEEYKAGAELFMHIGDISYANGQERIWDTFMDSIEPFARHIPYHVGVGNHEYGYELGSSNRAVPDASGETQPYQPDWGNFGNDSGGECGVQISRRFGMPDVAEPAYWSRNLIASAAAALAAEGADASSSSGGGSNSGRPRNPTLGPQAGVFLQRVQQQAEAQQQQQQQASSGEGASRRGDLERQQQEAAMAAAAGGGSGAVEDVAGQAHPNPPFWYSFSYGSAHFVVLSTEHDLQPGSRQFKWLEHDLARVDRCQTPWLVVNMHRPMYVVYPHKSNRIVGDHLREALEDLFNEYRVDLVLSGHVHSYSRTCNVLHERCVPADEGGMTHIIVGCAGHKLTDVVHDQEDWLEVAAVRFGYGRVTVDSGYSLLFELVGDDGEVKDFVKLHNSRAGARGCGYGSEAEAQLAAAAVAADQAQEEAGCKGRGACAPLVRGVGSDAAPGASSAADA